jgi:chemotaxis protein CheX
MPGLSKRAEVLKYTTDPLHIGGKVVSVLKDREKGPYDAKVINAITKAVIETVGSYLGSEPKVSGPAIKPNDIAIGEFSTLVGLQGQGTSGSVAITFPESMLRIFASKFLEGQEITVDKSMLEDIAGEMGNLLSGAIKLKLSALGVKIAIGLPQVIHGSKHSIRHMVTNPVLYFTFNYNEMRGSVEFCFISKEGGAAEATAKNDAKQGNVTLF